MKKFTGFFFLISALLLFTQIIVPQDTGGLTGKIIDIETGEPIIGANVLIEGTTFGAATDLEGIYFLKNIPQGIYTVITSYISYSKTYIKDVEIIKGKTTTLDIALKSEAILVEEVLVLGDASKNYESALLNQRKKSNQIQDGISAEIIKRTNDSNTAETLRRVPGITLVNNKFIFVRGVSERYSSALLNNSPLASTEPDKKDFAFDLIPSNLIENTVVVKSFTPDEPGDFAGGLVKVNTFDFPSGLILGLSYTTSYTNNTSTKTFIGYEGGSTDFLGIDDGTRALPEGLPDNLAPYTRFDDSLYIFAKMFSNKWGNIQKKAPLNRALTLSFGNNYQILNNTLGVIFSLTYRDDYKINSLIARDLASDGFLFDMAGDEYARNVHWGILTNVGYKIDFHKILIKNNYTQDADDETFFLRGDQFDRSSNLKSNALRFVSRSLYSGQLAGESYFPILNGFNVDWRFAYSQTYRDEPDYRRYYYGRPIGSTNEDEFTFAFPASPSLREGGRFYSDLSEFRRSYNIDFTKPINTLKFKGGFAYSNSSRSFNSRLIGMLNPFNVQAFRRYGIDSIFAPENFYYGGLAIGEYQNATNNYTAGDEIFAFYFLTEFPFSVFNQDFSFIAGVRNENYILRIRTRDFTTGLPLNLDYINPNLLPSINLIYKVSELTNIRASYSQTLNRPQFREVAPFSYFDFQEQTNTSGNIDLREAKITNYDLRIETFPDVGELYSFSLFYKEIQNPIEKTVLASSGNNVRTFINGPFAKNWGFELELRTSLGRLYKPLSNFSLSANYTRLWSETQEFNEGVPDRIRRMEGQSPYVVNVSLNYKSISLGAGLSIMYYKFGERIVQVASIFNDDWIETPRDLIDLVFTKDLGDHFEIKIGVKDLLAQNYEIKEGDIVTRNSSANTKYTFGVGYRL